MKNLQQRQNEEDDSACFMKRFDRVGISGGIGVSDRNTPNSEGSSGTEADTIEYTISCEMENVTFWGWVARDEFSMRI